MATPTYGGSAHKEFPFEVYGVLQQPCSKLTILLCVFRVPCGSGLVHFWAEFVRANAGESGGGKYLKLQRLCFQTVCFKEQFGRGFVMELLTSCA